MDQTIPFSWRRNWWIVMIWALAFLVLSALWFGAWWFLIKRVDLFIFPEISVLRYDVLIGPIFIGDIKQLWHLLWLASGIFVFNNVLLLIAVKIARFYSILLVTFTFILEILLSIAFFILLYINLKQ